MWLPLEMVAFTIGKRDGREPGHALHKNFCDAMVSGALRACDGVCRLVLPEIYFWWFELECARCWSHECEAGRKTLPATDGSGSQSHHLHAVVERLLSVLRWANPAQPNPPPFLLNCFSLLARACEGLRSRVVDTRSIPLRSSYR